MLKLLVPTCGVEPRWLSAIQAVNSPFAAEPTQASVYGLGDRSKNVCRVEALYGCGENRTFIRGACGPTSGFRRRLMHIALANVLSLGRGETV